MPAEQHYLNFEQIVDTLNRGVYGIDTQGNCMFINQAATQMLGYPRQACIGKNMHSLIHYRDINGNVYPESECAICTVNKAVNGQHNLDHVYRRADGSAFNIRHSSSPIIDNGIFKGIVIAFSDISDQKNKEAALTESEQKYKLLFDNNPSPMFIWDFETLQIVDCNEEALIKYGYSREEFLKLNIRQVRPAEDIALINEATKSEASYGSIHKKSWRHLKKNGDLIHVEVTGHVIEFNGRKASLVLVNDITEKLKAENELKNSEEKLRIATKIAGLGYWQVQLDGKNRYWSDEVYTIWGADRDSFAADYSLFYKTIHPDDRERFAREQAFAVNNAREIDFEYRIILPDGSMKWVHEIGKLVAGNSNQPAVFRGTVQDITPRKLLSLSLEEINLRYNYVTKATSDAIWDWDLENDNLYWGEGFEIIFGYNSESIQRNISSWTNHIHPEDIDKLIKGIYAVIDGTETKWKDEYRYLKADGTYAYVVDRGFVIRNAKGKAIRMVGAMHDITKRKTEVHHLKLIQSIITHTTDAVLITDANMFDGLGPHIVYVNEAFTRMTGYNADEVMGKTPLILQGPKSDVAELRRLGIALRKSQPCEITTISYKKNGEEFWANFSINPVMDDKGILTHYVAIQRDVTEQKKAELELKLFAGDLYERNKELNQFGYIVSHNLRSPVANIMGIANLLELDSDDPDTVARCTHDLKIVVNRLDSVIKDLSQIVSITDGSTALTKEKIDLNALIAQVVTDLEDVIYHTEVEVSIHGGSHIIYSHKAYLYSVFYNLVSNAIKYRSNNSPRVTITIVDDVTGTIVTVEDNGIGIDLIKHRDSIFKPYKRFNLNIEGKGLGLFLVKSHIEALGGYITIDSEEGSGSVFTIGLPASSHLAPEAVQVSEYR
ncbi:PAS domain S-box protein [Mucilaginibacter sp. OK283]|uniref:PAS domain-containing sensor histidine kinase n=1 Tax=Mucilaginibacter sp. OK283 TaxID=1881049 RepID=UPI0008BD18E3|nr:PAS domain S-box protein [Mucilaginibacter sp. OK283]SEO21711.1 PAS domain S-box-containing protein [Mucilaginibacter sp. OK283]